MSVYINHLAAHLPTGSEALSIPFAWPFEAWRCIIPASIKPKVNILEKLILSLIDKRLVKTDADLVNLLVRKIGLNAELIENAIDICKQKGYISKRATIEIQLNDAGKEALSTCYDNSSPLSKGGELNSIYLLRELATGALVPLFNIENIPNRGGNKIDSTEEYEGILVQSRSEEQEEQQKVKEPKASEMQNAIRTWKRLLAAQISADSTESRTITTDGNISVSEASPIEAVPKDEVAFIQMVADKPERCYLDGYFVLNRYCPTDVEVISPFGEICDNWFAIIVNRFRKNNKDFEEHLQQKTSEKREALKNTIAFHNVPHVALFDRIPIICNDDTYTELKNRILSMNRYLSASDEERAIGFHDFAGSMRGAIEFTIREAIRSHPEFENTRQAMKNIYNSSQSQALREARKYALMANPQFRASESIIKNMITARAIDYGKGSKDMLILIAIHSTYAQDKTLAQDFVSKCHDWMIDLPGIVDDIGNTAAHANTTKMQKTPEEYYAFAERVITETFEQLILRGA